MSASLVIPCYNESAGLPLLVKRCDAVLKAALDQAGDDVEIVLVDNGSTDATQETLRSLGLPKPGVRVAHVEKNQGYGFGILEGLRAAKGDRLGWTHADLQTDPMDFLKALAAWPTDNPKRGFVKGTRIGRPFGDTVFTLGMSVFETALMGHVLRDVNAQPTVFHRSFLETWIDEAPHDFALDLFAYYKAKRAGLDVERFPVRFEDRQFGASHWNIDFNSKVKFIKRTIDFSLKLRRAA